VKIKQFIDKHENVSYENFKSKLAPIGDKKIRKVKASPWGYYLIIRLQKENEYVISSYGGLNDWLFPNVVYKFDDNQKITIAMRFSFKHLFLMSSSSILIYFGVENKALLFLIVPTFIAFLVGLQFLLARGAIRETNSIIFKILE